MTDATSSDPGRSDARRSDAGRSRAAILRAVVELLNSEGPSAVTHQRVAEQAGVHRATVYRHWPQPADLLQDALAQTTLHFLEPAPGTLLERLGTDMRRVAQELNQPGVISMAATIIERAQWDATTRALRDRLVAAIVANAAAAVDHAVGSGELAARPDPGLLVDQLLGPLWIRRLLHGELVEEALVQRVIDDTLRPWLASDAR